LLRRPQAASLQLSATCRKHVGAREWEDRLAKNLHRLLAKAFGVTSLPIQRFNIFLISPRNSRPNLAQYISERPELTFHDEKSKKAKTTKEN
jgi:hypothetical protein